MKTAAALVLVLVAMEAFTQQSVLPHPRENLAAYKARMETYFAPRKVSRGEAELLREEGSEYNQYLHFLRQWEPRLYAVEGDFGKYMEQEAAAIKGLRRRVALRGGMLSMASTIATSPWRENGPIAKQTSTVGAEGVGPIEFITFFTPAPSHMLCGSTAGGLFYSTNAGVSWSSAGSDTNFQHSGVGSAVFHPDDFKTWFASTSGNGDNNEPMWIGFIDGVFRTRDEGATWTQIASHTQLGGIWTRIIKLEIDPADANHLWAATSNGLFETKNALAASPTWTNVAYFTAQHVYDFELRPGNAAWQYATTAAYDTNGNFTAWRFVHSSNGGMTWQNVPNQPVATVTASGLTIEVSPAKADNLYCVIQQPGNTLNAALYIFDFATGVWTLVKNQATVTHGSGHGFGVSRFDPNEIFLSEGSEGRRYRYDPNTQTTAVLTYNSTYYTHGTYHPDIEDIVPHPVSPHEVWMTQHGGVSRSTNYGATWSDSSNGIGALITLFMATSKSNAGVIALGTYHSGTMLTVSSWYPFWSPIWSVAVNATCDGMRPLIDPSTTQYIWASCGGGQWYASSNAGATFAGNLPSSPSDWRADGVLNATNPQTQYRITFGTGGQETIKRTSDRGATWQQIADFAALYPSANYDYILWSAYTPETSGDYLLIHLMEKPRPNPNGLEWRHHLYRTKIANAPAASVIASWEHLALPSIGWPSCARFDPADPNLVYLAYGSSGQLTSSSPTGLDMLFLVDYTTPAATWQDLTQNLPNTALDRDALAVERSSNGGLYLTTSVGVWYSDVASRTTGAGWTRLGTALPNVRASGIELNYVNRKVRVATKGRGVWEHDLVPMVSGVCTPPPANMTAWWRFEELGGSVSHDAALNDDAGIKTGGPATITGKVGKAMHFTGSGQYIDVPSSLELNVGTGDFTIDAWVRTTQAAGINPIIDRRSAAPIGYSLYLDGGLLGLQMADRSGSATCSTNNATSACTDWIAPAGYPNLADGAWHHVAATVKRGDPQGGRLYADGFLVLTFDPTIRNLSLNSSAALRIGGAHATSGSGASSFKGDLDEVEVIKRALTDAEVRALVAADSLGKCFCVTCQ